VDGKDDQVLDRGESPRPINSTLRGEPIQQTNINTQKRVASKAVVSLAVILLVSPILFDQSLLGWGNDGHRFITGEALNLVPSPIRFFFEKHRTFVVEHSIDPDLWRTAGFLEETTRHFLDLDAYGSYPFDELPRNYDKAIQKFSREKIEKGGLLPWRTSEVFGQLVEAFRRQRENRNAFAGDEIQFFAAVISHYVSDAEVPLHAVTNYDGQLTGQNGIHFRFESDLFLRNRARIKIQPGPIIPISNPRDFVFDTLLRSYLQADSLLIADKKAAGKRRSYDELYYDKFFALAGPILAEQLNASITATASLIAAAWEQAGKPDLAIHSPVSSKKRVRRGVEAGR
jgi:hypothetical protein